MIALEKFRAEANNDICIIHGIFIVFNWVVESIRCHAFYCSGRQLDFFSANYMSQGFERFVIGRSKTQRVADCKINEPVIVPVIAYFRFHIDIFGCHPSPLYFAESPEDVYVIFRSSENRNVSFSSVAD